MASKKRINAGAKKAQKRKENSEFGIYMNQIYNSPDKTEETSDENTDPLDDATDLWSLRNNDNINYIRVNAVIHDKSCRQLDSVAESEYIVLERYDRLLHQCEDCALRSCVRKGCLDFDRITFYEKIFKQGKIPVDILEEMYLHNNMTTYFDRNILCVQYKEDSWKIEFDYDFRKARLYHNNYIINDGGKREIMDGYHIQVDEWLPTLTALTLIKNYSFEEHKKNMKEAIHKDIQESHEHPQTAEKMLLPEATGNNRELQKTLCSLWEDKDVYGVLEVLADIQNIINETRETRGILEEDLQRMMELRKRYI